MSKRTWNVLAVASLMLVPFAGCQSGKLNMPNLAFWKSNELDAQYIEPPAHSLAPAESQMASNRSDKPSRDLYQSSPPTRPMDIDLPTQMESDKSSYEQLADKSFAATPPMSSDDDNGFVPPKSSGMSSSQPHLNNSLTPKMDSNLGQPSSGNTSDFMPPSNSGTGFNQNRLIPDSNESKIPTQNSTPLTPQGNNSLQPKIRTTPYQPDNGTGRIQNPYSSSNDFQPEAKQVGHVTYPETRYESYESIEAPATQQAPGQVPSDTATIRNTFVPQTKPMDPPADSGFNPPTSSPPSASPKIPEALLHGQGSYAPGSVSAPKPLLPEKVRAPASGGSFQPN